MDGENGNDGSNEQGDGEGDGGLTDWDSKDMGRLKDEGGSRGRGSRMGDCGRLTDWDSKDWDRLENEGGGKLGDEEGGSSELGHDGDEGKGGRGKPGG